MQNNKRYFTVFLKGMAMGAADVVPGVSGGTVAFISGIYQELVDSLRSINMAALRTLFSQGVGPAWRQINGNFLLAVFGGILLSLFSMARIIVHAMDQWPELIWAFFFGLVCASTIYVGRQLERWRIQEVLALGAGLAFAIGLNLANPTQLPDTWWMLSIAGAIAICAMILPGVSGTYVLLLLGLYSTFLQAISQFQILILASFGIGCVAGLLSFAHVLSWLLREYHSATMAVLTGFLLGSLQMIWPWRHTVSFYENRRGELEPLMQELVLPGRYAELTGNDPMVGGVILAAIIGMVLVGGLELWAAKTRPDDAESSTAGLAAAPKREA